MHSKQLKVFIVQGSRRPEDSGGQRDYKAKRIAGSEGQEAKGFRKPAVQWFMAMKS